MKVVVLLDQVGSGPFGQLSFGQDGLNHGLNRPKLSTVLNLPTLP